ncbi:class I SAM-dependent methyltransferase [Pseudobutyrivibrio xylanivorans]|uniref:Class I SAM-dependent methyltransferase n=1 Tax=Pseudobutyrivibrio xylanivorans TaxID=185007 RepID=A0A5P6VQ24_PSEXY|nr:class I SAM-dependent methyltransferase [Pseudobutyrivibrio xylanivorans]QFJ54677.1 class I SAM-dependent methyltransferase [Pseudobutyrivibrio xylanivorans]
MGELHYIAFEDEATDIKDKVESYWTKRAESFFDLRHDEIESKKANRWLEEIEKLLSSGKQLNILDVGCGTGFFEVILGRAGHKVTGIDLTPEMVSRANEMIGMYGLDRENVKAITGDAEHLPFDDESFDVVISRNLTWTLPHPIDAYTDWFRVLKKGGMLINFDAEYAKGAHNLKSPENLAHSKISDALKDECHDIYHMLTISMLDRPMWDESVLCHIGYGNVNVDLSFGDRIFIEHDEFYIPDKMFCVSALKPCK